MWLAAIAIAILLLMLVVLAYVRIAARKIEQGLMAVSREHAEMRSKLEQDLNRTRALIAAGQTQA